MRTVYVTQQGAQIGVEDGGLKVRLADGASRRIHLFNLGQLILVGRVSLSAACVTQLLRQGIDTCFISFNGKYLGRLQGQAGKNIPLRIAQFSKFDELPTQISLSAKIVYSKLQNQRSFLMRIQRTREHLDLAQQIVQIRRLAARAIEQPEGLDTLRGMEGQAAKLYFEGMAAGLPPGWSFRKRSRRPPGDPVNAMLSLGYTLLLHRFIAAVETVGFDPYRGFFHGIRYGRPSLALDLLEVFRSPIVDSLVLGLLGRRVFSPGDFEDVVSEDAGESHNANREAGAQEIRFSDEAFRRFLSHFEKKLATRVTDRRDEKERSYLELIEKECRHLAAHLLRETDDFRPFETHG